VLDRSEAGGEFVKPGGGGVSQFTHILSLSVSGTCGGGVAGGEMVWGVGRVCDERVGNVGRKKALLPVD